MALLAIPAGIDIVIMALAATLIIYGATVLIKPLLIALASHIPLIGKYITKGLDNIINTVQQVASRWASWGISPLAAVIQHPVNSLDKLFGQIRGALSRIVDYVLSLSDNIAQHVLSQVTSLVDQLVQPIKAWAWGYIEWLSSRLHQVYVDVLNQITIAKKDVEQYAVNEVNQVHQSTIALINQETSKSTALANQAIAKANNAISQAAQVATTLERVTAQIGGLNPSTVTGDIQSAIQQAESYAKQAEMQLSNIVDQDLQNIQRETQAVEQSLQSGIQQAVTASEQFASQAVNQTRAAIAAAEERLKTYTEEHIGSLINDITTVTDAIAANGLLVGAVEAELTSYLEKCGKAMCNTYRGRVPQANDITNFMQDGILFALIALAAADPEGCAQVAEEILGPVVGDGWGFMNKYVPGGA